MYFFTKMDVLLYSKFSNRSTTLLNQLRETPELLESLTLTCIDNKSIRDRIVNDEKIKITGVPCFIRLNETTNTFDLFEGDNAFRFFHDLQQQIRQERASLERQKIEMERAEMERERIEREREHERERAEQERKRDMESEEKVEKKTTGKKKTMTFTPIEDLEDLNDENTDSSPAITTYTHVSKTEHSDFSERDVSAKTAESVVSKSTGNLLSRAMKMQKERDQK